MNITGFEVTNGKQRGVVVDGVPRKSGPWKGKVSVMWIGGSWPVIEDPEELTIIR